MNHQENNKIDQLAQESIAELRKELSKESKLEKRMTIMEVVLLFSALLSIGIMYQMEYASFYFKYILTAIQLVSLSFVSYKRGCIVSAEMHRKKEESARKFMDALVEEVIKDSEKEKGFE